ncbi:GNAT family N-acetyltransferase [Nesterenkonia suensis]
MPELRLLVTGDAPQVLAAFDSDPAMSRQGEVSDLASAEAYIRAVTDAGAGRLAFAVDVGGSPVGLVGLSIDRANRVGWFFYWMHRDHRGRGLMTTAARSVADWALTPTDQGGGDLHRLELGHRRNNPRSGAIARAAGFVQEGLEREKFLVAGVRVDVLTWGRLRDDPVPLDDRMIINTKAT